MKPIDEDYEAWERYPQFRSVFNKLELSLKLGYNCGPACVPVTRSGMYIIRPIYNLYGMSVSARFAFISRDDKLSMENHKFVPRYYHFLISFLLLTLNYWQIRSLSHKLIVLDKLNNEDFL